MVRHEEGGAPHLFDQYTGEIHYTADFLGELDQGLNGKVQLFLPDESQYSYFNEEALNQKLTEIFSISWDIKSTVNQTNACFHQRQNLLEHCRQNKSQIDTLLVELRKELRTIMSGGKTNE